MVKKVYEKLWLDTTLCVPLGTVRELLAPSHGLIFFGDLSDKHSDLHIARGNPLCQYGTDYFGALQNAANFCTTELSSIYRNGNRNFHPLFTRIVTKLG